LAERLHFLDGLRGWASCAVVMSHTFQTWLINPIFMAEHDLTGVLTFINWTPLGIAMDGTLAVYVFFAISGVALTYPVLTSKHPMQALSVMTLVRYPRLTIPIAASSLIAFLLLSAGLFFNQRAGAAYPSAWLGSFYGLDAGPLHLVRFALYDVYFRYPWPDTWNAVLWTMQIELVGSFALFAFLALARNRMMRVGLAAVIAVLLLDTSYAGFFSGVVIAELILRPFRGSPWAGAALLASAVCGAIAVRSGLVPASLRSFNLIAGAMVAGVTLLPVARLVLGTPLSRFMGRLSFSLYLVHLIVICSIGSATYLLAVAYLPLPLAIAATALVTIAASFAAAALFELAFERTLLREVKRQLSGLVLSISIRSATAR
jgi:peptidoglycan/LPS O-acetylase OafA/YrhL